MLKTKLGKAEHDALDESLKSLYVPDGEGFKLDADYEDVDGLKAKRDELLGKVTEAQKALKAFEGLDPEAARAALEKVGKLDDEELLGKRKFDELLEKRKGEWATKEKGYQDKIAGMVRSQAEQQLSMKLAQNGVKPHMAEGLALILTTKDLQFVEENGEPIWKSKDGLETIDLDKYIPGLKDNGKADYFDSKLGQGSGAAPGNQNNGGNAKTITRSQYDANPGQYAAQLGKGEIAVVD